MGKRLIIKGADFSVNALPGEPVSAIDHLLQGYVGTNNNNESVVNCMTPPGYRNSHPNSISGRVMVVEFRDSSVLELLSESYSVFIPEGLYYSCAAVTEDLKTCAVISTAQAGSGGVTISKSYIYNTLNVSENDYPYYAININKSTATSGTSPNYLFTPEEAVERGVTITKASNVQG